MTFPHNSYPSIAKCAEHRFFFIYFYFFLVPLQTYVLSLLFSSNYFNARIFPLFVVIYRHLFFPLNFFPSGRTISIFGTFDSSTNLLLTKSIIHSLSALEISSLSKISLSSIKKSSTFIGSSSLTSKTSCTF